MQSGMTCPRCHAATAPNAPFCSQCGTSLRASAPGVASNRSAIPIAIGATLALIALALWGATAAGWLRFGAKAPDSQALRIEASPTGGALQLPAKATGQPSLDKTAATMPDDVRRYLEFLERIEKKKVDISNKMIAQLQIFATKLQTFGGAEGLLNHDEDMGGDGKRPDTETQGAISGVKGEWTNLVDEFKSYPPPAECQPLADNYYRALSEIPGMAGDIMDLFNMIATDPAGALQKAKGMQNTSANQIDRYFKASDGQLGDICSKYNTAKWFSIREDVGGGSLAMPGLGGLGGP